MANRFVADLHFGHKNVLAFDARPFGTIEEHDAMLVEKWNSITEMTDDVWILGDISWHNATKTFEIFRQLNGNKHLVRGNHDSKLLRNKDIQKLFVEILDYKELEIGNDKSIVLSHYPIPCFKNHYYGWLHFYGHVHTSYEENIMVRCRYEMEELYNIPCKMYNVGAMAPWMDYTPKTADEIVTNWCQFHKNFTNKNKQVNCHVSKGM